MYIRICVCYFYFYFTSTSPSEEAREARLGESRARLADVVQRCEQEQYDNNNNDNNNDDNGNIDMNTDGNVNNKLLTAIQEHDSYQYVHY